MVKPINLYFVGSLLRPWADSAEDDERHDQFEGLDPNDEAAVRSRIREDLVTYYERWDHRSKDKGKMALQFALSFLDDRFFRRTFDSELIIFEPREPVRTLFEWLWEELFGDEDWRLPGKPKDYQLENAIWQPNTIKVAAE
jgi:hypothetical protein